MKSYLDNSSFHPKPEITGSCRSLHSDSKTTCRFFFQLLIINLLICLPLVNLPAQQPTQEWVARYQRTPNSSGNRNFLDLDKLGNTYVVGEIYENVTSVDIVIIKYNSVGDSVWTRRYNSFNNVDDSPQGIAVDSLGNAFITCYTGLNLGPFDVLTLKYSPIGTLLWVSRYAGSGNTNDIINDIKLDLAGNIIVTGFSGVDALTIKYNILGDSIWVRKKQQGGFEYSGGFIGIDVSSAIHIAGTKFNISSNQGDIMVLKYDSSGIEQWVSSYANPGLDGSRGIAIDGSGNSYVTGDINSGANSNYVTVKYNSGGIQQWARVYNGLGNTSDEPFGISVDSSGNVIVTGASGGIGTDFDYLTIKYNSIGDSVWVRRYNGPGNGNDEAYSIVTDDSGNSYITGRSIGTGTSWDYATIKYTPAGIEQWVERYNANPPGNGEDIAYKIAIDNQQNIFVTGRSKRVTSIYDYLTIKYSQPVGIVPISNEIPDKFFLYQNYPNPFNPNTIIRFQINRLSDSKLNVYDVNGRLVAELVNHKLNAGTYKVDFSSGKLSSGIYFYKLQTDNYSETRKMMVIK